MSSTSTRKERKSSPWPWLPTSPGNCSLMSRSPRQTRNASICEGSLLTAPTASRWRAYANSGSGGSVWVVSNIQPSQQQNRRHERHDLILKKEATEPAAQTSFNRRLAAGIEPSANARRRSPTEADEIVAAG